MYLDQRVDQVWQLTNPGGNASSMVFPIRVNTVTPPDQTPAGQGTAAKGDGVIACGEGPNLGPFNLILSPIGIGSVGSTFMLAVYGWRPTSGKFFVQPGHPENSPLWKPYLFCILGCTLGAFPGVNGSDLPITYLDAGSITLVSGSATINNGLASVSTAGFPFLEVIFQAGTCDVMNCLYAKV